MEEKIVGEITASVYVKLESLRLERFGMALRNLSGELVKVPGVAKVSFRGEIVTEIELLIADGYDPDRVRIDVLTSAHRVLGHR